MYYVYPLGWQSTFMYSKLLEEVFSSYQCMYNIHYMHPHMLYVHVDTYCNHLYVHGHTDPTLVPKVPLCTHKNCLQ